MLKKCAAANILLTVADLVFLQSMEAIQHHLWEQGLISALQLSYMALHKPLRRLVVPDALGRWREGSDIYPHSSSGLVSGCNDDKRHLRRRVEATANERGLLIAAA
jgi:hypothetical protein